MSPGFNVVGGGGGEGNLACHHTICHLKFKRSFPPKSKKREKRSQGFKLVLKSQQSLFTKPRERERDKAATEAIYSIVSHLLAKHLIAHLADAYIK